MHKNLIRWLSKIIKKKGSVISYARLLGDAIVKFLVMSGKDGYWRGIKANIIYYIFHTLIPKSVLVFHTFAPISFDDSNFIIARP